MPKSFLDLVNDAMKGIGPALLFSDNQLGSLSRGVWPGDGIQNSSGAAQSFTAATRTYIGGSALQIPQPGVRVGSVFKWKMNLTKTGAGSAASTFDIAVGTTGTTTDTAVVSFTKPAGTAVIDEAWIEVQMQVQSIGASGVLVGEFQLTHNLAATGHATIPIVVVNTVSSAVDLTRPNLIFGLCITSGAADAVSCVMVQSEAYNL